jgi:hypothetical protein
MAASDSQRRVAAARCDLCSSAGMGRGWATVCGFGCSAPPCRRGTLWCSVPWPRRKLTSRPAGAAFKQSRRSQFTRRASHAGHGPCAPRRCIGAAAGGPPTAWSTLALPTADDSCSGAVAQLFAALWRRCRCQPRMVGKRILEVKGEPGRRTGRRTWKDSLPRRPRLAPMHRRRRSASRRVRSNSQLSLRVPRSTVPSAAPTRPLRPDGGSAAWQFAVAADRRLLR